MILAIISHYQPLLTMLSHDIKHPQPRHLTTIVASSISLLATLSHYSYWSWAPPTSNAAFLAQPFLLFVARNSAARNSAASRARSLRAMLSSKQIGGNDLTESVTSGGKGWLVVVVVVVVVGQVVVVVVVGLVGSIADVGEATVHSLRWCSWVAERMSFQSWVIMVNACERYTIPLLRGFSL